MSAKSAFAVFLVISGTASGAVRSQPIPPPPLPPGNSQVRVDAGMTEDERNATCVLTTTRCTTRRTLAASKTLVAKSPARGGSPSPPSKTRGNLNSKKRFITIGTVI